MRLGSRSIWLGVVVGSIGSVLALILLSVALVGLATGGGGRGGQSIDYPPISLERAIELIDGGQVYMVAIRKEGNIDEYFTFEEVPGHTPSFYEESRKWNVDGTDVHVFTDSMPTGVPLTSGSEDEVGISSEQLTDVLRHVDQFNAASSWQIKVLDQRQ